MSVEEIKDQVLHLNPEPVAVFTFPSQKHLKYKEIIEKIIKEIPKDSELISKSHSSYRICHDDDQHIFEEFELLAELKEDIHMLLLSYIQKTGWLCDEMVIVDAWINNDGKNSALGYHYHTNSYLSGTYYINYDGKVHTPLSFVNDRITAQRKGPSIELTRNNNAPCIYNQDFVHLPVKEGSIVMWKSHLTHGYERPNTQGNRISLSFNAMPKRCRNSTGHYSFGVVK